PPPRLSQLRHGGQQYQLLVGGAAYLRRGLAQQPSPPAAQRRPRPPLVRGGCILSADPGPGIGRAGIGRGPASAWAGAGCSSAVVLSVRRIGPNHLTSRKCRTHVKRRSSVAEYSFITRWRLSASQQVVWDILNDSLRYPEWWPGYKSCHPLTPGVIGVGAAG